ncbi:MAG: bifunctional 5,10-methylenetetrahydrofolate dehydrogenase/5,10-methenyltetrahydrofolate cyclohydrolase, partial [Ktedonobacteraceae bacterium]|nr:bifunctional 5,10-methylenetetrahydrofolate dehydrogenase/5,10-methenyltetrahydrofolate cyclohydrolase [Ktedonobacteraceae bacterium]
MTATIIDGRALGKEMRAEMREDVRHYVQVHGRAPGLAIVRVEGDPASGVYSKAILRLAEDLGVDARLESLPATASENELKELLLRLNGDEAMQGVIVQMPLPAHIPQKTVADTLSPAKDIDGISPMSAGNLFLGVPTFLPSTAAAV